MKHRVYIVKTKSGKIGFTTGETLYNKIVVHIVDIPLKFTGEKLLCLQKNLMIIGYAN